MGFNVLSPGRLPSRFSHHSWTYRAFPPADPISESDGSAGDFAPAPAIPWLRATAADLGNLDFEAPIAGSVTASSHELSEQYRRAVQPEGGAAPPDTPETRIFTTLAAVTGMYLKAHDREEPFGPAISSADGRRSAIPADFRGTPVDLLAEMAPRAANPVLRARLADVCWLLDRKRGKLGGLAVAAYVEIVEGAESGALKFASANDWGGLEHGALDDLRRALQIGRAIGWEKPEVIRAGDAVARLRERAVEVRAAVPAAWFAGLDLDFRVSDPVAVAGGIEEVLAAPADADVHRVASLWGLASRAYQLAKRDEDRYRCQSEAAEAFAAGAERVLAGQGKGSAMLASHMMSNAIAQLHGIPAKRERRTELRHRLVDIQARIPEEMSVFSHHWDLKEIEAQVTKAMGDGALFDQLFLFAAIAMSPDPANLATEAEELIRQHPLSSLVAAVHAGRSVGRCADPTLHRPQASQPTGPRAPAAARRDLRRLQRHDLRRLAGRDRAAPPGLPAQMAAQMQGGSRQPRGGR